jgi:hypothetical protein
MESDQQLHDPWLDDRGRATEYDFAGGGPELCLADSEGRLVREHDSFGCIVPNEP